jgi:hypothetical protein
VVYCVIVPENRHAVTEGISFPLYFMTAMAAYGAMWGSINPGARIARDRSKGWVRALRITPLRVRTEIVARPPRLQNFRSWRGSIVQRSPPRPPSDNPNFLSLKG